MCSAQKKFKNEVILKAKTFSYFYIQWKCKTYSNILHSILDTREVDLDYNGVEVYTLTIWLLFLLDLNAIVKKLWNSIGCYEHVDKPTIQFHSNKSVRPPLVNVNFTITLSSIRSWPSGKTEKLSLFTIIGAEINFSLLTCDMWRKRIHSTA